MSVVCDLAVARAIARALGGGVLRRPEQAGIVADFVLARTQHHLQRRLVPLDSRLNPAVIPAFSPSSSAALNGALHHPSPPASPASTDEWPLLADALRAELTLAVRTHDDTQAQRPLQALDTAGVQLLASSQDLRWGEWRRQLEDIKFQSKMWFALALLSLYGLLLTDYALNRRSK